HQGRPDGMETGRFFLQPRNAFVKRPEVLQGERMLLDRDVMQPPAARRISPPCLPSREEIQAEPEAGLEDDEALAPRPALLNGVALQKDVTCLLEASRRAVIDVAESFGIRNAVEKCKTGRHEGGHLIYIIAADPHDRWNRRAGAPDEQ